MAARKPTAQRPVAITTPSESSTLSHTASPYQSPSGSHQSLWGEAAASGLEAYRPNNMYVKHFGSEVTDESLRELFEAHGGVISCRVLHHRSGASKCVGFVQMHTKEHALGAIASLHGKQIAAGKPPLHVALALSRWEHRMHAQRKQKERHTAPHPPTWPAPAQIAAHWPHSLGEMPFPPSSPLPSWTAPSDAAPVSYGVPTVLGYSYDPYYLVMPTSIPSTGTPHTLGGKQAHSASMKTYHGPADSSYWPSAAMPRLAASALGMGTQGWMVQPLLLPCSGYGAAAM